MALHVEDWREARWRFWQLPSGNPWKLSLVGREDGQVGTQTLQFNWRNCRNGCDWHGCSSWNFHKENARWCSLARSNWKRSEKEWRRHCLCRLALRYQLHDDPWKIALPWPICLDPWVEKEASQDSTRMSFGPSWSLFWEHHGWLRPRWFPWSHLHLSN